MKHELKDYTLFDLFEAQDSMYQTDEFKTKIAMELNRRFSVIDEYHEAVRVHNLT